MNDDDTAVLTPVPADDLAVELARAAPRRWWNRATVVLGALVLVVGGFAGGLQAQKRWGPAETPAGANRAAGGFGGQNRAGYGPAGGFGNFGGQAQGGAAPTASAAASGSGGTTGTTGTVKLVNGTTIYVQTADGELVTVRTDGATTVATAEKGRLSDVKAGQPVTVRGTAGEDGTITATSVTTEKK